MPSGRQFPAPLLTAVIAAGALLAASQPTVAMPLTPSAPAESATTTADLPAPVSRSLDAVDPTAANNPGGLDSNGNCFPGCRGAGQLLAYTPAFGSGSTGTNGYGSEVVVEDGRVTAIGGNDRTIPTGGFVLSGHGEAAQWLGEHMDVGVRVELSGTTVTVVVDAEARVIAAELAREDAGRRLGLARESCTDFSEPDTGRALDEADRLLTEARTALDAGREETAITFAGQAATAARKGGDLTRESRPVEGRGVWVRPTETTPQDIRSTLDRIETAGFNTVFLETVWQGYTIFPSDAARAAGVEGQRPNMKGFDPLKVWIEEAHQRGIELHAWTHTFFVGAEAATTPGPGPVLRAHPEWAAVEREDVGADGPRPSSQEVGYYFVDPAIPEARDYVASIFEEIMSDYAVDGLHLDYIRYPVSQPYDAGFSYSDYSRDAFRDAYGVDPYTLTETDAAWKDWNAWREQNVTTFVERVRTAQQRIKPDLALSAAVFADPTDGLAKKFQNWGAWVDAGYMDFLTGMSFGSSPESVAHDTAVMRERVGDVPLYTATYGPFHNSPPALMSDQLQAVKDADSDGTALFAYNQLTDAQAESLSNGAYRTPATAPHADPAGAARDLAVALRRHIGDVDRQCVPQAGAATVRGHLKAAAELLATPGDHGVSAAEQRLEAALKAVGAWGDTARPTFTATTERDLRMALRWLERARK